MGIISKKLPKISSMTRGLNCTKVFAPKMTAGTDVAAYTAVTRQSMLCYHSATRVRLATMATSAITGTACMGP